MNFFRSIKRYHNKILALFFTAVALGLFISEIITSIAFGSVIDILTIISWVFVGGVLCYLLFTNVRNDPNAYQAIVMWIFLFFLSEIRQVIYSPASIVTLFRSSGELPPLTVTFAILQPIIAIATLGLGIYLYILVRRYMYGLSSDFKRVRLIAILYALVSFLSYSLSIATLYSYGLIPDIAIYLPSLYKVSADIAVIFTLERLRRI